MIEIGLISLLYFQLAKLELIFKILIPLIFIQVHIRDEMYIVHCGVATQKIRWLADVAVHRYDPNYGMTAGWVHDIKLESGIVVN